MSDSREFNASTVEEAVAKAVSETGYDADSLSYEVLDQGSDGFLGIGVRDARILVHLQQNGTESEQVADESDAQFEPNEIETSEDQTDSELSEAPDTEKTQQSNVSEDLLIEVQKLTDEVLRAADVSTKVDVYDAGEYIAVDLVSDHTALLIGQKGETIDALQHIINSAAYRDRDFEKRIILDSEGYRQRRIEAIQGMANRMARKAYRESQEVQLPPMNASERRIVHVYLQEDDRIETHSEGAGDQRRVTISPK